MSKGWFKWLVAIVALAMLGMACSNGEDASDTTGGDSDNGAETASANPFKELREADQHVVMSAKTLAGGIDAAANLDGDVSAPASELLTQLTQILQEHVYFAGIAVDAAFSFEGATDAAEFKAAAETLDANSVALADLIGSVVPDKRDAFLELWRQHIGFFVDYAVGAKTGDESKKAGALEGLANYRQQAGAFFEEITGGAITASAVEGSLEAHVTTLAETIDAFAQGSGDGFAKLKAAADHMDGAAAALGGAVVQATNMEGAIDAPAAKVRASLTGLLQEHVLLAGIAVKTAFAKGLESAEFTAAAGVLDQNSVELADLIGTVAPQQRDAFLELWRQHIGFFVEYAKGVAGGDEAAKSAAVSQLDQYRAQAGEFFSQVTGGELPADAVAAELDGHVKSLTEAIDALGEVLIGS